MKPKNVFLFFRALSFLLFFSVASFTYSQENSIVDTAGIPIVAAPDSLIVSDSLSLELLHEDSLGSLAAVDSADEYTTIFDELFSDEIPLIRIRGDFSKLIKEKYKGNENDAELSLIKDNEIAESFKIDVEARGKSRRKICHFPPLKLKFKSKQLKKKGLTPAFRNLKLVTHCFDSNKGEKNIIREYLIYKMYSTLTDYSYRVQLVQIEYEDIGKKNHSTTRYGFLIENNDEMAYRNQGRISPSYNFDCYKLDQRAYCRMIIFQYMIGNQDWRIKFLHNIKLIKPFDNSPYIPVPYDFDYSGLVDSPYSVPNPDLPTRSVQERCFMGDFTHSPEIFKETLQHFRDKKEEILAICEQSDLLDKKDKKYMLRYLESFYKQIRNDKGAINSMIPMFW